MTRSPARILFTLSLAAIASLLPAQQGTQQRIQPPHTEQMTFTPAGTVRIDESHGDVNVEGWDQPEVEVTVVKSMPYDYKPKHPEEASKHLDSVRVATERKSPTELTISTMHPGSKNTDAVIIKYEIHVPRESKLTIHRATGSVFVIGLTSDIEVECSRGDIQLMLRDRSAYSIDAASKLGTVISDFEGTTKLRRYRLGERYATASAQSPPRIYLRMGFGGITIKAVPPEAYSTFSAKGRNTPHKQYGCSQHHNRGACPNGLRIPKETIEHNLFAELQSKVLTADVVDYVIKQFTSKIREGRGRIVDEISAAQVRQRELETELGRLTNAIAEAGHSRFVLEAIAERERELEKLAAKIDSAGRGTVETHPGNIRAFITNGLRNLLALLSGDTTRARAELAKYTSDIRMIPEIDENGGRYYVAEGGWNLFGGADSALVAGEGFEPSTFGL